MKNKFLILFLFAILSIGCSKEEDGMTKNENQLDITAKNIQGTWLAVEYSEHSGSEFEPFLSIDVDYQYKYTFKSDLSFLNTSTANCNGFYEINQGDKKLILNFENSCSARRSISTISKITNKVLILIRSAGDEAIKIKYQKQ